MDQIIIENLQIFAHHGVYREENEKGQNFYINAVLETDIMRAGRLDDLELSTNYGEVCRFLDQFIKGHTYKLIETVAEKAAEAILLRFPLVRISQWFCRSRRLVGIVLNMTTDVGRSSTLWMESFPRQRILVCVTMVTWKCPSKQ